jgi:predicted 2-oxoglutarate/Fe(II)-dependent dioxygenase YbiX
MSEYRKKLFPISIFHSSVENNNKIKDLLIPHVENYKKDLNTAPSGWMTTKIITSYENDEINSIFQEGEELSNEIKSQYTNVLDTFFDKKWQGYIESIWFNYYENGEYQEFHTHLGTFNKLIHFAGVHFVSFDSSVHNSLIFLDPISKLRNFSLEIDSNNYNEIYTLNAKEGDIVIFPSYLEHGVKSGISTPGNPRITISFNISIQSYDRGNIC